MPLARRKGPIGGSANAAGAEYGASIAAWAACRVLLGSRASLPWSLGEDAYLSALSSECDEEVDDLQLSVAPRGTVYIQIKHGLRMDGEFDKGIAQLARQFATSPLGPSDRLVLVTDATASTSIRKAVPQALSWFRELPASTPLNLFPHGEGPRSGLSRIQGIFETEYLNCTGKHSTEVDWRKFLAITYLTELNTLDDGGDKVGSLEALKRISPAAGAGLVWSRLNGLALQGARLRRPLDWVAIQSDFVNYGIELDLEEGGSYATVEACARHLTQSRIDGLELRGQYARGNYVHRSGIEKQLEKLTKGEGKITVIVGGSGNGKTTWCASKCDSMEMPLRLLVPAESIDDKDDHLRDTLCRLIDAVAIELADRSYSQTELRHWLKVHPIEVFVDGLDRAFVPPRKLALWLENTVLDIQDFDWRLIATTRPEIKSFVEQALGGGVPLIEVGGYSEVEAIQAARGLGAAALAKYRNPRMMSFCARLWATHGSQAFRHEQAVQLFLTTAAARAAGNFDLLLDDVEVALTDLSIFLAASETGVLSAPSSRVFQQTHPAAYNALRKENVIISEQGVLRVDIDEIAEHLAGRQTDVAAQILRWSEIREIPLKAGALRAAMEQLAARFPQDAARYVHELACAKVLNDEALLVSLLCAVISAFEDPSPVKAPAAVLLTTWKKENFLAAWGTGFDLLNLANSGRWDQADRVELLWILARMENGLDWRSKHWIKPHVYSSYEATPWRRCFLEAVEQTYVLGWAFLQAHFSSKVSLLGSNEANLGDLAQGGFVSTARVDLPAALAFVDRLADDRIRQQLVSALACRYPIPILELFLSEKTALAPSQMVEVALEMRSDDWSPHPAIAQLATHWLDRIEFVSHRRTFLRIVATSGNRVAAEELMAHSNLDSMEVGAIFALDMERFAQKLPVLLSGSGDLQYVFDGLARGDMRVEHVRLISSQLRPMILDAQMTPKIAGLCEHMLYLSMAMGACPKELVQLARAILESPSARARSYMVYPASTARGVNWPAKGKALQTQLLDLIVELETDAENLNTLRFKLKENHPTNTKMKAYCDELARRHPGLDWDNGPNHCFTRLE